jgi:hypothetical protein
MSKWGASYLRQLLIAIPQKSPHGIFREFLPLATEVFKLDLRAVTGSNWEAKALAMLRSAVSLSGQVFRRNAAPGRRRVGFRYRSLQQFPGSQAMSGPLCLPLLSRRPQEPTLRVAKVAFEFVVGPRQTGDVVTME